MRAQIGKWGNSLAVRIPGGLAKDLHLREGTELEIAIIDGELVLRRIAKKYSLDELVAGITPENRHGETDWGSRRRREAW